MNRLYFGDNLKWLSDRKEFPTMAARKRAPEAGGDAVKPPYIFRGELDTTFTQ